MHSSLILVMQFTLARLLARKPSLCLSPRPLAATATARFTSKVADPIHGLTAVVPTNGGVIHALQPDPGHAIHHGQASAQPSSVPSIVQLPAIDATLLSDKPRAVHFI